MFDKQTVNRFFTEFIKIYIESKPHEINNL